MARKQGLDTAGAVALLIMSVVFGINNLFIRFLNEAFQPAFSVGLRSAGAAVVVWLWMQWAGVALRLPRESIGAALLIGLLFGSEFLLLFIAIDLTTVVRASVLFYSMPVWLALGAHFLIDGERLTGQRIAGLTIAFAGVVLAFADRLEGGAGSLLGDVLALVAAMCWASVVLVIRSTSLSRVAPEIQLLSQLVISAPLMVLAAPLLGGDLIREPAPIHILWYLLTTVGVAAIAFIAWFRLLAVYPSWTVASFSFLTPVAAVLAGWLVLGEPVGPLIFAALFAVAAGIVLINRPPRAARR